MRILYDHQAFTGTTYGGISRYFVDLMENLALRGDQVALSVLFSNNLYLQNQPFFKGTTYGSFFGSKTSMVCSHLNRAKAAIALLKKNYDVFHPTFHNPYFLDFIGKKPFVVTYHDAIPEIYHQRYGTFDGIEMDDKKRILEKATQIIAISNNTKKDLLRFYDVNPDKISVVYHATAFSGVETKENTGSSNFEHEYLLFVGSRDLYKNFDIFVESVAETLLKNNLWLVCVGGGAFCERETKMIDLLGLSQHIKQISVDDTELHRLYGDALAFVYPSEYEGFGIPIIEAFAAGCPVLLSNSSCFPEIAEDAGLYFNPKNKEEISYQVNKILFDTDLKNALIHKGFERVKHFSIQSLVNETLNVYKKVIL